MEKKALTQMVRHILRKGQGLPDHHLMHPFREWLICLIATIIILIIAVILCIQLYRHYNDLSPDSSQPASTGGVVYQTDEVDLALTNFRAREELYTTIKNNLTAMNRPALPEVPFETTGDVASSTPTTTLPSEDSTPISPSPTEPEDTPTNPTVTEPLPDLGENQPPRLENI